MATTTPKANLSKWEPGDSVESKFMADNSNADKIDQKIGELETNISLLGGSPTLLWSPTAPSNGFNTGVVTLFESATNFNFLQIQINDDANSSGNATALIAQTATQLARYLYNWNDTVAFLRLSLVGTQFNVLSHSQNLARIKNIWGVGRRL